MVSKPVCSERHIGIDQDELNFAVVVGTNPNIADAKNYTDLQLKDNFDEHDVLIALKQKTGLLLWMQPSNKQHKVQGHRAFGANQSTEQKVKAVLAGARQTPAATSAPHRYLRHS